MSGTAPIRFALVVQASPADSVVALEFAGAALAAGHAIERVFFLGRGTECARIGAVAAGWTQLAQQRGTELSVCVSGAARRGLYDAATAADHGAPTGNIAAAFSLAGLGLLVDAIASSDRVLTFL